MPKTYVISHRVLAENEDEAWGTLKAEMEALEDTGIMTALQSVFDIKKDEPKKEKVRSKAKPKK